MKLNIFSSNKTTLELDLKGFFKLYISISSFAHMKSEPFISRCHCSVYVYAWVCCGNIISHFDPMFLLLKYSPRRLLQSSLITLNSIESPHVHCNSVRNEKVYLIPKIVHRIVNCRASTADYVMHGSVKSAASLIYRILASTFIALSRSSLCLCLCLIYIHK